MAAINKSTMYVLKEDHFIYGYKGSIFNDDQVIGIPKKHLEKYFASSAKPVRTNPFNFNEIVNLVDTPVSQTQPLAHPDYYYDDPEEDVEEVEIDPDFSDDDDDHF